MAKLVTIVRTYFKDGTYRNNRVEMQLPDEIAANIKNYWSENGGAHKCCEARYLANNQSADCLLYEDNSEEAIAGISYMTGEEVMKEETFSHSFKDEEEDDE